MSTRSQTSSVGALVVGTILVVASHAATAASGETPFASPAHVIGSTAVGPAVGALASDGRSVWAAYTDGVARIDPSTGQVVLRTTLGVNGGAATVGQVAADHDGHVWMGSYTHGVVAPIDPETGVVDRSREVPVTTPSGMAIDDGTLWVASGSTGSLLRIDAATGRASEPITVAIDGPITAHDGTAWVPNTGMGGLARIDPSGTVTAVDLGLAPGDVVTAVSTGAGAVWAGTLKGALYRVDPGTLEVIAVPAAPVPGLQYEPVDGIAVSDDAIWVAGIAYTGRPEDYLSAPGYLVRIDPTSLAPTDTWSLDAPGANAIALAGGQLWVSVGFSDVQRFAASDAPDTGLAIPAGDTAEPIRYEDAVTYTTAPDGTTVPLDIYGPTGAEGAPVVILLPGGPGPFDQRWYLAGLASALAERGVVALVADYRSSATFDRLEDADRDAACAVVWARDHAGEHGGNPSRVVVAGHSYGGYLIVRSLLAGPDAATCDGRSGVPDAYVPMGKIRVDGPVPTTATSSVPTTIVIGTLDDEYFLAHSFTDQLITAGYDVSLVEGDGIDHFSIIDTRDGVPTLETLATIATGLPH